MAALAVADAAAAQPLLGPCLYPGMGEAAMCEKLNSWGVAHDRELISLRADLGAAHTGVMGAFASAETALVSIAADRRLEAEAKRQGARHEAAQAICPLNTSPSPRERTRTR